MFVSNAEDPVAQASSVTILRNLARVRTAKTQTYTLVFDDSGGEGKLDAAGVLAALQRLLPYMKITGNTATMPPITVDGKTVTVTFKPLSDAGLKSPQVTLGITGAYDGDTDDLAALGVEWFVQLQPLRSSDPNLIWNSKTKKTKSLDDLEALGEAVYAKRAFYEDPPEAVDWAALAKLPQDDLKTRIPAVQAAVEAAAADRASLAVLTGVDAGSLDGLAALTNLAGAMLTAQDGNVAEARKAVLLDLSTGAAAYATQFAGLMSPDEEPAAGTASFKTFWTKARRSRVVPVGADVTAVKEKLGTLQANQVLVVSVGDVPADVVDYSLTKAKLPGTFSEDARANFAVNRSAPYLWLRPAGSQDDTFVPIDPSAETPDTAQNDLVDIAGSVSVTRRGWPGAASEIPPTVLGDFLKRAFSAADSDLKAYFPAVAGEYHEEENDKLLSGLVYFVEYQNCPEPPAGILDGVYKDLCDAASSEQGCKVPPEGKINLFGIQRFSVSSPIGKLLKAVSGAVDFNITGSESDPLTIKMPDEKSVVVTGSTTSLVKGETLSVTLTFTQELCDVKLAVEAGFTGTWQLPLVPWFTLGQPQLELDAGNVALSPSGTVSGVVGLGEKSLRLSLPVPVVDDTWQLTGDFGGDGPKLADAFQLVGGINLVKQMPEAVQGLTTIGIQKFEIKYDQKKKEITSFGLKVCMQGDKWVLIRGQSGANIEIDRLAAAIVVTNPKDTINRKTAYQFATTIDFGGGEQSGKLAITAKAPDFTLSAGIPDDSPPIQLHDVFGIFYDFGGGVPFVNGELSKFDLLVKPADPTTFTLATEIDNVWKVDIPAPVSTTLEVKKLGFGVEAVGDDRSGRIFGQFAIGKDPAGNVVVIDLSADYDNGNWVLEGRQSQGKIKLFDLVKQYMGIDLSDFGDVFVTGLYAKITTKTGEKAEYEFGGSATWKLPFGDDLQLIGSADVKYGKTGENGNGGDDGAATRALVPAVDETDMAFSGKLSGTLKWGNDKVVLTFSYLFGPDQDCPYQFSAKLGPLLVKGKACKKTVESQEQWIGTLSTKGLTLGLIVETLVTWATGQPFGLAAPWNVLDEIPLDVELEFNFTTHETTLKLPLDIDLGFAKLSNISLKYNPNATGVGEDRKVAVTLDGSFLWLEGGDLPPWDATDPDSTPTPSGGGNKYFDLRLLGLGQHVAISGSEDFENVQDAIEKIRDALDLPAGCEVPVAADGGAQSQFVFAPESSWLIAADFGVLKFGDDKKNGDGKQRALPAGDRGSQ